MAVILQKLQLVLDTISTQAGKVLLAHVTIPRSTGLQRLPLGCIISG